MKAVIPSTMQNGIASCVPSGCRRRTRTAEVAPRIAEGASRIATGIHDEYPSLAVTYMSRPTDATAKPYATSTTIAPILGMIIPAIVRCRAFL